MVAGSVQGAVSGRVVGGSGSRTPGFASMAIDGSILNTCVLAENSSGPNIQGDQPEYFEKPEAYQLIFLVPLVMGSIYIYICIYTGSIQHGYRNIDSDGLLNRVQSVGVCIKYECAHTHTRIHVHTYTWVYTVCTYAFTLCVCANRETSITSYIQIYTIRYILDIMICI